jgi:sugar phosphate isomerase/epimerase
MTTRRTFLAQTALLSAGLLAGTNCVSAKPVRVVGLQLYSLRDQLPKDVKGVIAKVASAGYKEVETFGYSVKDGFWGLDVKAFKQLLNDNGLSTPSGHYGIDEYLASGKDDELKLNIEAAKIIGQTYLTVPYLDGRFRKTVDDFKAVTDKLNKVAELCKQSGLQLGYHNHDFEFTPVNGTMLYDVMLNGTDKSLVHFEMDLYWVVRAGQDPVRLMEKHPGRFVMVHVKDMDKAKPQLNTEIGSGSIDYKTIAAKAKISGVKHFIVEQENFAIDPYQSITQSCNYVKNTLLV